MVALVALALSLVGVSALPGRTPHTQGHLTVVRAGPTCAKLDFWETRGSKTVTDYDVDMTKRLHLVAIAANFSTFLHLHPHLDASGHFTITMTVPRSGLYRIYADTLPHGDPQTVFRFSVPFGTPNRAKPPIELPAAASAGPYVVSLDTLRLKAGSRTPLHATITRAGRPATDLTAYLGAAAHVVLIDTKTLAYVHVHPEVAGAAHDDMAGMPEGAMPGMSMGAMPELPPGTHVGANLSMHADVASPGNYFLWVQFAGGNAIRVARFLLRAD